MTSADGPPREILAGPIALVAEGSEGARLAWAHRGPQFTKRATGAAEWHATSRAGALTADVRGRIAISYDLEPIPAQLPE